MAGRRILLWADPKEDRNLPAILGGYSLGGLFALWAETRSDAFSWCLERLC